MCAITVLAAAIALVGYLEKTRYNPASSDAIHLLWAGGLMQLVNMPVDL
jgi:hypothetical protein